MDHTERIIAMVVAKLFATIAAIIAAVTIAIFVGNLSDRFMDMEIGPVLIDGRASHFFVSTTYLGFACTKTGRDLCVALSNQRSPMVAAADPCIKAHPRLLFGCCSGVRANSGANH
jgi:hypothetical protein